jgi:homopolymeric O-antigen transport system permease protein
VQTFTDLYKFRFVLTSLVSKNLKVMYRNMALGLLWSLLNPLVMIVTLSLVWAVIFKQRESFTAMVIVVLVPYNFFVYCLTGCASSIPGNASLVKKIGFPRQILPISIIVTHLIHFAIQFTLVVGVLAFFSHPGTTIGFQLLWLVPIFIVQLGLCVGGGLLVAGLNVLYRDVQYIIESLLTVLFWLCPIIYEPRVGLLPLEPGAEQHETLYFLYYLNPLSGILSAYRSVLYHGRPPDADTFAMAIGITIVIGILGVWTFWRHEKEFADLI